jgi:DNA-binding PadR family transcriptional regulator
MMILGIVQWMQPVHGYDVRRELLSWSADKWANVQPGSIYHALRKLSEEGLLHEVSTDKGAAEFQSLLRDRWWNVAPMVDPFMAAFSFLSALPREEAAAALRNRALQLRAGVHQLEAAMGAEWLDGKPVYVSWMWERSVVTWEAEIAWCERTAKKIEANEPYMPSSIPNQV